MSLEITPEKQVKAAIFGRGDLLEGDLYCGSTVLKCNLNMICISVYSVLAAADIALHSFSIEIYKLLQCFISLKES